MTGAAMRLFTLISCFIINEIWGVDEAISPIQIVVKAKRLAYSK